MRPLVAIAVPSGRTVRIAYMRVTALTDVESVALWAGLIVGIASVVLAIVAIYFSVEVDRRSTATATETSRSLERIESVVTSQSRDTRDLIKVGWERMLPTSSESAPSSAMREEGAREIAAGMADEIRARLGLGADDGGLTPSLGSNDPSVIDDAVELLRATLESQLHAARQRPGDEVQFWLDRLESVTEEGQALARAISRAHLTAEQVEALDDEPLVAEALSELRQDGLLVPLRGYNRTHKRTLVYWYPPGSAPAIQAALLMMPEPAYHLAEVVDEILGRAGYPDIPAGRPTSSDE